jgi:predicted flavoprotein YhiN
VSAGWRSFMHVWTVWDSFKYAENFWINVIKPHRGLSGLVTREDLKEVSWVSTKVNLELISKSDKKPIYRELWPILFTHFWVSWPIIHNCWVALWEYLNSKKVENEEEYLKENISIKITFDLGECSKSLVKFFELSEENLEKKLNIIDYRSWKEAKVTGWWVALDELTNKLESKSISWLYFAWEALDLTWKTGWFNLQLAWSSWALVWKSIK